MTLDKSHAALVAARFGPRAWAYVASAVHARGADLDHITGIVRRHPAARVLDLGCGGGHVTFHVAPHVRQVIAYDLSAEMLDAVTRVCHERALVNVTARQGSVEQLPFDDASFDFVISRYSGHNWHDFRGALRQARRILKPGGLAIFVDVVSPGGACALLDTYLQTVELLRDPSHVRDYSTGEWRRSLTDAGFAPNVVTKARLRIEFFSWVERIATPDIHIEAIRSLQANMAADVIDYFAIEPDGSFSVDTMMLEAS